VPSILIIGSGELTGELRSGAESVLRNRAPELPEDERVIKRIVIEFGPRKPIAIYDPAAVELGDPPPEFYSGPTELGPPPEEASEKPFGLSGYLKIIP
jgi:hypothetical protein